MNVLIRSAEDGKVLEAEIEGSCRVGALKSEITESFGYDKEGLTLLYKRRKMADDTDLDRYSVEDNDLLVLEKRDKVHLDAGFEAVEKARDWLRQNIVTSETDVRLRDYSLKEGGENEMIFGLENEPVKLVVSGGKIDDYGLVSSEDM